jgi:dnd system-associated protein 4
MRDRIRPASEHNDLLNQLREDGIFATRQKAMMFAAALGYRLASSDPVEPLTGFGEGIPLKVFENAVDDRFIDALAVTIENDLQVLDDKAGDHRLDIFEHFARIGLDRIALACYQPGKDPLQGILDLIDQYQDMETPPDQLPGLAVTAKKLGQIM